MPTAKLYLRFCGIASASHPRTRNTVSSVNRTPARKIAPSAICHEYPSTLTTVKAIKAFSPMYGAMAKGRLAYSPITSVPNAAEMMVAVMDGPLGIPAASRMAGLTTMMYAMVRNVVKPASSSCR